MGPNFWLRLGKGCGLYHNVMNNPPINNESALQNLTENKDSALYRQYYADNEQYIEKQWEWYIWPRISGFDFSCTLDLACGFGRNATKLISLAKKLYLVDVNPEAIAFCKNRFSNAPIPIEYIVNSGTSLASIGDAELTTIYSWDSMVHFAPEIVAEYIKEFSRVLSVGGRGFIHHSNYGAWGEHRYWRDNPGWRSNVSAAFVADCLKSANLRVTSQHMLCWDYVENLDCLTCFEK